MVHLDGRVLGCWWALQHLFCAAGRRPCRAGDVYVVGCPPRPEALFYALLKLQDKIDNMTLAKRPTEVRLEPQMVEEFKKNVMVAQVAEPQ